MIDKEKVIKGLEELYGFLFREYANIPAEESKIYYERTSAVRDGIALLKKQETVEQPLDRTIPHWIFGNTMGHSWMKCSECCVSQSGQTGCWTYCPNCGAEMKGDTEVEID